jgi:Arc/MetJ family transcription regulator
MTRERKPKTPPAQTADEAGLADTPEYLAKWSRELVKAAGKRDARLAAAEYRRIAANRRVPAAERKSATRRAKAIEKYL